MSKKIINTNFKPVLPDCLLHLNNTGIECNDNEVIIWKDVSGNNNNFIKPENANGPSLIKNHIVFNEKKDSLKDGGN